MNGTKAKEIYEPLTSAKCTEVSATGVAIATAAGCQHHSVAQNKRKEKARIAARVRRGQEASIIMEMANELQITQEKIRRIDKATIVKLAIDYIKAFEILCRIRSNNSASSSTSSTATSSCDSNQDINDRNKVQAEGIISGGSCSTIKIIQVDSVRQQQQQQQERCPPISITPIISQTTTLSSLPRPMKEIQEEGEQPRPILSTGLIFAPKTDDMDSHFLIIKTNESDGKSSLVLKPDTEILEEDDLTHLAPQAGDISISLDVEPLDSIELDTGLFVCGSSPPIKKKAPISIAAGEEHHDENVENENSSNNYHHNNNHNHLYRHNHNHHHHLHHQNRQFNYQRYHHNQIG